jgi:hypothetical protein
MSAIDTPLSNPRRYGSIASVCNRLVDETNSRNAAFTKIFGNTTPQAPTDALLQKAYQLFYQEEPLPAAVKTRLYDIANTQAALTDKWKLVLLGLCVSPEWQSIESQ